MLSAPLKYAIVQNIKLYSCSLPIYYEKDVIGLDDLIVPATTTEEYYLAFTTSKFKEWNEDIMTCIIKQVTLETKVSNSRNLLVWPKWSTSSL